MWPSLGPSDQKSKPTTQLRFFKRIAMPPLFLPALYSEYSTLYLHAYETEDNVVSYDRSLCRRLAVPPTRFGLCADGRVSDILLCQTRLEQSDVRLPDSSFPMSDI